LYDNHVASGKLKSVTKDQLFNFMQHCHDLSKGESKYPLKAVLRGADQAIMGEVLRYYSSALKSDTKSSVNIPICSRIQSKLTIHFVLF
jgi:hypothetical protein